MKDKSQVRCLVLSGSDGRLASEEQRVRKVEHESRAPLCSSIIQIPIVKVYDRASRPVRLDAEENPMMALEEKSCDQVVKTVHPPGTMDGCKKKKKRKLEEYFSVDKRGVLTN
ncbi:unnamed protein product [Pleuronectes platessa]|uniref:Uncharacterized protein n=1 Tax=Pleuronectes platessa TaxID=8262 RepID=A0A9N7YUZ1_PLEPL|nr:unnamed protein product [Pleuronectes platessa]